MNLIRPSSPEEAKQADITYGYKPGEDISRILAAVKPIYPQLVGFVKELKLIKFTNEYFEKTGSHSLFGFFESFRLYSGLKEADFTPLVEVHDERRHDSEFYNEPYLMIFLYLIEHLSCLFAKEEDDEEEIPSPFRELVFYRFFMRFAEFIYDTYEDRYDLYRFYKDNEFDQFRSFYRKIVMIVRTVPKEFIYRDDQKLKPSDYCVKDVDSQTTRATYDYMRCFMRVYLRLFEASLSRINVLLSQ